MNFLQNLIQTLGQTPCRAHLTAQTARLARQADAGVDIYELDRRVAEDARTRLVLYASGVGR